VAYQIREDRALDYDYIDAEAERLTLKLKASIVDGNVDPSEPSHS
jgi:hypothetical protein